MFRGASKLYQSSSLSSRLTITKNKSPPPKPSTEKLPAFGVQFSAHMLKLPWSSSSGWGTPVIEPFGPLNIHPAAASLHYAVECFEGLKAYRGVNGEVRLFRPDENAARFQISSKAVALPELPKEDFIAFVNALVDLDRDYVPNSRGASLYIRPTMIADNKCLGVTPPHEALFYIILSPCGPYWSSGLRPVKLFADPKHRRAWPGGSGASKVGANYGPTIRHQKEVAGTGCQQILWLNDANELGEVGAMNIFVAFRDGEKRIRVATPKLDGTILPGVTRKSIIDLIQTGVVKAADGSEVTVAEEAIPIDAIAKAAEEGKLVEVFGAGTAAIVTVVDEILYGKKRINIPTPSDGFATTLMNTLLDIQHGNKTHKWSIEVPMRNHGAAQ